MVAERRSGRFLLDGPAVVVPGRLAGPVWRALDDALRRARADGIRSGLDDLEDLALALMEAAAASDPAPRSSDVGSSLDGSSSEAGGSAVTVAEAAALLGIGDRRVRQLLDVGQLTGRLSGGVWLVDVVSIEERRRARRTA